MPTTNDDAYNNRTSVPGVDAYIARWETEAQAFRARARARLDHAYGAHPREKVDLFYPKDAPLGLMVFVHGGYWLRFDRSFWSHYARAATDMGWVVAVPSYPLCPEVRIADITRSVAACLSEVAGLVDGPIVLAGHSAGGHLVARMLNPDASLSPSLTERIRHAAVISMVSDLRPLIETSMNADFQLDAASAISESPALQPKALGVPVSVWVGADELPAFLNQSRWLAEAWPGTELHIEPGRHHFDVIDPLLDPDSAMMAMLLT